MLNIFSVYWDILFIVGNNCEAHMQLYARELIDEIPGKKRVSKKNKMSSNNRYYIFLIKEFIFFIGFGRTRVCCENPNVRETFNIL